MFDFIVNQAPWFGFAVLWISLCIAIASVGGWLQLSRVYRAESDFLGERWRFRSLSMRWGIGYNNVATIGADTTGLYLTCLFLFRAGHPPLLVPWGELSVERRRYFLIRVVKLTTAKCPNVPIRIRESLFEKLQASMGPLFPDHLAD